MTLAASIIVNRGEGKPAAATWIFPADPGDGAFALDVLRGPHPAELPIATLAGDCLSVERLGNGVRVLLNLSAEDIAAVQGARRPVPDFLCYMLRCGDRPLCGAWFLIFPPASVVEGA